MAVSMLWHHQKGRLAQLGERHVRNVEAEGSIPLPSTKLPLPTTMLFLLKLEMFLCGTT
jgi:hypothetical protein